MSNQQTTSIFKVAIGFVLAVVMLLLLSPIKAQNADNRNICDSISSYYDELWKTHANRPFQANTRRVVTDTSYGYGPEDSIVFYYYPDGQICYEKHYLDKDLLKTPPGYFRWYKKSCKESYDSAPSRKEFRMEERYYRTCFRDSILRYYYPNGQACFEEQYLKGKCCYYESYYSNGQIFVRNYDKRGNAFPTKESFSCDYGDYLYQYGFKVKRRSYLSYNYDGSISRLDFIGKYQHRYARISIHFVCGRLFGAWIYNKQGRLIAQFDWDEASQSWSPAAVPHVLSKREIRHREKVLRKSNGTIHIVT